MTCSGTGSCHQGRQPCRDNCSALEQRNSDGSDPDLPITMYETFDWIQSLVTAIMLVLLVMTVALFLGIAYGRFFGV